MKILLISQDWFKQDLEMLGCQVVSCGADQHFDVCLKVPLLNIEEVFLLANFIPDKIVIFDNSIPIFITGLEKLAIPIIYYAVDVQHHINTQKYFTNFFEKVFVAQKDYLADFESSVSDVEWLPLWASKNIDLKPYQDRQIEAKAVFVGTLNAKLNPERVAFFEELKNYIPLECMMAEYWKVFPYYQVVLNQTVKGDLNFRVFEALMCESVLVTEDSTNGLSDLFKDGVHLHLYPRGNAKRAAEIVNKLLKAPNDCQRIAVAGRKEVLEKHTSKARADILHQALINAKPGNKQPLSLVPNFTALAKYLENDSSSLARQAINESIRLIEVGIELEGVVSSELFEQFLLACNEHQRLNPQSLRAKHVLERLQKILAG